MVAATRDDVVRWDRAHLWHPFTQMQEWLAEDPLVIAAGDGNYLVDADGRRYLDGVSSLWCNVHGHRHPAIDAAVRTQLDRVAHTTLLGLASPPSAELAARLAALAPRGLTRVFYSDAGATAVEIALKMAWQYWRLRGEERERFVALSEGYHGDTLGAMSVGFSQPFHRFYRPLLEVDRVASPYALERARGLSAADALASALAELEETLRRRRGTIAAVVMEPLMQGAAGMWPQPVAYLPAVRALTRAYDTLLVCDEVATGFGRTARLFACDHSAHRARPDDARQGPHRRISAARGDAGERGDLRGVPRAVRGFSAFFHGHTFTGNALACAAALASLDLFTPDLLAALPRKAALLARQLERARPAARPRRRDPPARTHDRDRADARSGAVRDVCVRRAHRPPDDPRRAPPRRRPTPARRRAGADAAALDHRRRDRRPSSASPPSRSPRRPADEGPRTGVGRERRVARRRGRAEFRGAGARRVTAALALAA